MKIEESALSETFHDLLDRFIREGDVLVEALRLRLSNSGDVGSRTILERLLHIHTRYLNEIRSQFDEIRSREEITRQINEMFEL